MLILRNSGWGGVYLGTTGTIQSSNIANILQSLNTVDHRVASPYAVHGRNRRAHHTETSITLGIVAIAVVLISLFTTRRRSVRAQNRTMRAMDNRTEHV